MNNEKGPKLGAGKTVLQIVKVSVSSGRHKSGEADMEAIQLLQDMGFVGLKNHNGRVMADCPKAGHILFEYDKSCLANRKPARIVTFSKDVWREAEPGCTIYVPDDLGVEILFKGDTVNDWQIYCIAPVATLQESFKIASLRGQILGKKDKAPSRRAEKDDLAPPSDFEEDESVPPPVDEEKELPPARVPKKTTLPTPAIPRIVTPVAPPSVNGVNKIVDVEVYNEILRIPPQEIVPMQPTEEAPEIPGQPRTEFIEETIIDLANNILEVSQLQPGLVRRIHNIPGKKWELIAGERRLRAVIHAKLPYYLAREVKSDKPIDRHMIAIIENNNREDQNPLDTSNGFAVQIKAGRTQGDLVRLTGITRSTIEKYLAIQGLHPELKPFLKATVPDEDRIRLAVGDALAKIHPNEQVRIWNEAKKQPTQGLILAKVHQLGRQFFILNKGRGSRWMDGYHISNRIRGRFTKLKKAMLELESITDEQWIKYAARATIRGSGLENVDVLEHVIKDARKIQERLKGILNSEATRQEIAQAPPRQSNGYFVRK